MTSFVRVKVAAEDVQPGDRICLGRGVWGVAETTDVMPRHRPKGRDDVLGWCARRMNQRVKTTVREVGSSRYHDLYAQPGYERTVLRMA